MPTASLHAETATLSVVVVTRDRRDMLVDCLACLGRQRPSGVVHEVVIVDDGSSEPLDIRDVWPAGVDVRIVRQTPSQGLSAGRNRGVAESSGTIVAFLDDDTRLGDGWAAALVDSLVASSADAVAGRISLELEASRPRWLTDARLSYLSSFDHGDFDQTLTQPPFGFGANFAVTRATLTQIGGFRTDLGRAPGSLLSNEETDLLVRIVSSGGRVTYSAGARVHHRVSADRLTKPWFRNRARAQGESDARSAGRWAHPSVMLVREVIRAGRSPLILGRRLVEGHGPFDALLWIDYCVARARRARLDSRPPQVHR